MGPMCSGSVFVLMSDVVALLMSSTVFLIKAFAVAADDFTCEPDLVMHTVIRQ